MTPALFLLLAAQVGAGAITPRQAAPPSPRASTQIEQLEPAPTGPRATQVQPATPRAADPSARISQLPGGLNPTGDGESQLARTQPRPAESRAALEVARAIDTIRGRGQQPTPELVAREVGPEVLEAYLSRGDVAAIATQPADGRTAPPPPTSFAPLGITIIPPGGQK